MMKRLIMNIMKVILIYIISVIMINMISALTLKLFYDKSYFELVSLLLCNQLYVQHQTLVGIIIALN